ncbi:protein PHOSPHATE-INDUCED 1-like [Phoenix dactylifera]|uniref:Protein PHOSPHATE-INDUCED 1-like n=1 Tax=Phoenix dactylifera TaxID=42345 RepID=A0A8B9A9D4_PHODC|nr:protein PHOSPHATE-INDUCED 1-like [Phoenix dactylifera]
MASFQVARTTVLVLVVVSLGQVCMGSRRLATLVQPTPLEYHNGAVLQGDVPITILWYGKFTPSQKSIISDFLLSLTPQPHQKLSGPSVSQWWNTIDEVYLSKAGTKSPKKTQILLAGQVSDEMCSLSKSLTRDQISELAAKAGPKKSGIVLVLTAEDVTVEGFCMSRCGLHGSDRKAGSTYIWVGNPTTQCPGQCAWPFHQPVSGPQTPPLVAPNGDVGIDGMVLNLASMMAGTVTNPFGDGFYQGPKEAPLEAATACPGVYAKGAYPGYPGDLLVDPATGASYNANGARGRKYLVPALFEPSTSSCSTLV